MNTDDPGYSFLETLIVLAITNHVRGSGVGAPLHRRQANGCADATLPRPDSTTSMQRIRRRCGPCGADRKPTMHRFRSTGTIPHPRREPIPGDMVDYACPCRFSLEMLIR